MSMKCGICGVFADQNQMLTRGVGGGYLAIVCKSHSNASRHLENLAKLLSDERHYRLTGSWEWSDVKSQEREIEAMRTSAGPGAAPGHQPLPVGRFS